MHSNTQVPTILRRFCDGTIQWMHIKEIDCLNNENIWLDDGSLRSFSFLCMYMDVYWLPVDAAVLGWLDILKLFGWDIGAQL